VVASKGRALEIASEQLDKKQLPFGGDGTAWSNWQGMFIPEGVKLVAAIAGIGFGNRPTTYLVYDNEGGFDWYVQALEVVIETCEWVLGQGDPGNYRLVWSG
jgi:hypothetical protein